MLTKDHEMPLFGPKRLKKTVGISLMLVGAEIKCHGLETPVFREKIRIKNNLGKHVGPFHFPIDIMF